MNMDFKDDTETTATEVMVYMYFKGVFTNISSILVRNWEKGVIQCKRQKSVIGHWQEEWFAPLKQVTFLLPFSWI